mmetsp:Transcript_28956/g.74302  ORF Transcript_28956/g.74302 Transcript_28956/m.74302 type:complete len:244 (-) Transcript_28956:90-821(-)
MRLCLQKPTAACCCCVPACCGLRGGVLTIAILQLLGAILMGISAIGTIVSMLAYVAADVSGDIAPTSSEYAAMVAYTVFNVLTACLALATGIMGIKATSSIPRVVALDPVILKNALTYFRLMVATWLIYAIPTFISLIIQSIGVYSTDGVTEGQATSAVIATWVWWAIATIVELYFIFVVWSYQRRLHDARDGNLEGPFVVKDVQVPTAVPAQGAGPAGTTYTAQPAYSGHPTYGGEAGVAKV